MSKITTFTTLAALSLGSTYLQIDLASARGRIMLMEPSQNAAAMNGPAQRPAASAATTTFTPARPQFRPSMENFANMQGNARGRPNYSIDVQAKQSAAISSIDKRSNINIGKFGALRNPAATGGTVPQAPTGTIYGSGKGKGGTVPGFGFGKSGFGKGANLPGASNSANGVKSVPGFENADNGPNVNLPGSQKKGSAADAANFMAAQENADVAALLDSAAQGPSVNLPSQSSAAQEQSDGLFDGVVNFFTGGSSDSAAKTSPSAKSGETGAPANTTNANGEGQGQSKATKEQHTVVISEDIGGESKDSKGNIYVSSGYLQRDAFTGAPAGGSLVTVGPITITKSKRMPNDSDTSTPVNSSTSLALNNPFTAHNQGGGTDNNVDQAGTGSSDIAANSSYAQKDNGDGTNDAGENHTTSSDTLTSNSSLAKKNQGDGGDDRGARSAALTKAN